MSVSVRVRVSVSVRARVRLRASLRRELRRPISPPYLPCISPISPLYLLLGELRRRALAQLREGALRRLVGVRGLDG